MTATPLQGTTCRVCEAPLTPGARFCHVCGTPLGRGRTTRPQLPWIIASVSVGLLIAVVAFSVGRLTSRSVVGGGEQGGSLSPTQGAAEFRPGPAPDISNMTPREQADRLFDRIMTAHEQGDSARVAFFLPMTLQAYARLGALDADARYHLGVIQAIAGRVAAARAQADSLEAEVPGHLFASMLFANAAQVSQDEQVAQRAYQQFLNNFDQEIGSGKPEYDSHRRAIDAFHREAQRALAERAGGR